MIKTVFFVAFKGRGRGLVVDPDPEEKVSEAGKYPRQYSNCKK